MQKEDNRLGRENLEEETVTSPQDRILFLVGTCFGLGLAPVAPGTSGALLGVVIFVAIGLCLPNPWQPWAVLVSLLLSCILTIAMSPWAERYWNTKDPKNYVLDEVAGFLMTIFLFRMESLWVTVLLVFPVTRAFDIVKIPPARQLEYLSRGWGILADDLWSSLYAAGTLHVLAWWLGWRVSLWGQVVC